MGVQISLGRVQKDLARSYQRLASGLRINGASDDSAGLAISLSMEARLKSARQAISNADDGISLAQTADGALAQISDNLIRMRELAVQAASGILRQTDRQALQAESDQLASQVSRIAKSTRFNGIALLNGTAPEVTVQVGPEAGDNISIPLASAEAENLGPKGAITIHGNLVPTASLIPGGAFTINGQGISIGDGSASALADGINGSGIAGLTATAGATSVNLGSFSDRPQGFTFPAGAFTVNGVSIDASNWIYPTTTTDTTTNIVTHTGTSLGQAIAEQITSSVPGVTADYSGGVLVLTAVDGGNIWIGTDGNNGGNGSFSNFDLTHANSITALGGLELSSTLSINIEQGLSVTAGQGRNLPPGSYPLSLASGGLMLTQQGAEDFIGVVDSSQRQILLMRSRIGSALNVLGNTVSFVQNSVDSLAISQSRIVDADVATETAHMVRGQILQQAGIAMLAQANQAQGGILALLRSTLGSTSS
jgi:flagellin